MDYARAMLILRPSPAQWTCGDTYESIQMLDGGTVPSDSDLQAAFAAYVSPKSWTTPNFFKRLTQAEQLAILTSEDPGVRILRYTFALHPTIESDNTEIIGGLNYLVSIGILTANRPTELLS